jgi:integrase/recombinase XerD
MEFQKSVEGYMIAKNADGYSQSTLEMYAWALKIMQNYLKNKQIELVSEKDLQDFFNFLRNDYKPARFNGNTAPLAGRSLDNIWTAMRSFFNWCQAELKLKSRPDHAIRRPRYKTAEIEPFTQAEIALLLKACERTQPAKTNGRESFTMPRPTAARDIALVMVLLDTGIRVSECARLRIQDVDILTGEAAILPFGTGIKTKGRHVYIGKVTKKALWRYLSSRETPQPTERLFLTEDDKPMDRNSIRLLLSRMGERAGVRGCHPHRFRHTFALEYLRNGGDPFTLQRLLGHSSMDMINNYIKLVGSDLEAAHRRASPVDRWRL